MRYLSIITALASLLFIGSAQAHHSNAPHFDPDKEISVTGTVREWRFINPHSFLYFDVQNDDGSVSVWRCETDSVSGLRQRGYTENTFVVGETITVTGNPARREENHCFFRDFTFADGTQVSRFTDVSTLNRGTAISSDLADTEIEALLFGDEPNISGHWWDGDASAQTTITQGPPAGGGMTGMGMGIAEDGSLPPRLARIASIGLSVAGQSVQDTYDRNYDDPSFRCEISNIIDALGRGENVNEIRQNGDTIRITYGYMDYERTIHLGADAHPSEIEPTPGGHSIGNWEGNTLVVDTVGFTPSILNAQVGIPTSEAFHVVERITYNEETEELERDYVATDAKYWTEEHRGSDSYRRSGIPYSPYNCENLGGINNLRPGTPEYEAELAKMEAAALISIDDDSSDSRSINGLVLAVLVALAISVFLLRKRGKAN